MCLIQETNFMTWAHRIIEHDTEKNVYFAIHEVFYDEAGKIVSWTEKPVDIVGDSKEGIVKLVKMMLEDSYKPVLSETKLLELIK